MITIDINTGPVSEAMSRLQAQLEDMSVFMSDVAEMLVVSTKARFATGAAPDGTTWAANSAATLARKSDPRPLFGSSGMLNSQIFPNSGSDFTGVASNRVYAAMMQFGGTKERFPHLWGNIPARPFLGLSAEDEANILAEITDCLSGAITP